MAALPGAAEAATLAAGKSCYIRDRDARIAGSGFAPESPVEFSVNGRPMTTATSDPNGDVLVVYALPGTRTEKRLVVRATDAVGTAAQTTIYVSSELRVTTDSIEGENLRTWRARFRLYGFLRGRAYLHYLNPRGRHKKTVRLGRLRGPCGRLHTEKRRVMPFDDPQYGRWRLQFDTRRRYSPATPRKRVVPVRVYRGPA